MCRIHCCFLKLLIVTTFVFGLGIRVNAQPTLRGVDLLCNGESFFAASNICSELSRLAREDGVLPQNESFNQVAVSGVPIATILNQFKNANPKPKFVVTDGGGIDLMSNNCTAGDVNCAIIQQLKRTMEEYIDEMRKSGVKAFIWMCYPDPQGNQWANLKKGQDIWASVAKQVMDATTDPKPLWVDLRTTWAGHYSEYTNDGIHCTNAGGAATAKAFWDAMKADNWAFFNTATTPVKMPATIVESSPVLKHVIRNGKMEITLSIEKQSDVRLQLLTVSGRSVFTGQRQVAVSGVHTIGFPIGAITPGMYVYRANVGKLAAQSTVLVP